MKFLLWIFALLLLFTLCLWFLISRPFSIPSSGEKNNINHALLKEEVRKISEDFYPRSSENPEILNQLSQYIFDKFSIYSTHVEFQEYKASNINYRNVIAKFGPETDKIIVIGAHYDSFSNLPGADDNATGVVGLFELSRLLQTLNLDKQIQLVAYTLEEPPYFGSEKMGSYIHAKSLRDNGKNVELMISLEMIGYFTNKENSQDYPIPLLELFYPTVGNFIAIVDKLDANNAYKIKASINQYSNIEAYSINAPPIITGIDFSDHRNYWAFDFPAVMVTDTSFFRNKNYHTEADTFDKLDYKKMAEVIFGVFKFVEDSYSKK